MRALVRPLLSSRPKAVSYTRSIRYLSSSSSPVVNDLYHRWAESSGERELLHLKSLVSVYSTKFDQASELVGQCRRRLEEATRVHEHAVKRHASLFMRRDQWDESDAAAFVDSTTAEVETRQSLQDAREALRRAEDEASVCQREYMDAMRRRYHEEHLWQEKWRLLGTYGTWALIGLNSMVFLGGQYFYQRRENNRLKSMEKLINEKMSLLQIEKLVAPESVDAIPATAESSPSNVHETGTETISDGTDANQAGAETTSVTEKRVRQQDEQVQTKMDWIKALQELDFANVEKLFSNASKMQIHGPSVALGAAATATGFLLVTLLLSRR